MTDPGWVIAGCAAVTLVIFWTVQAIIGSIWLMRQLSSLERRIIDDLDRKHNSNVAVLHAMEKLVMRHDFILEPEFNGSGRNEYMRRQGRQ